MVEVWQLLREVSNNGDVSLARFLEFFKQRARMEHEHAQAIARLTADYAATSPPGLESLWHPFFETARRIADTRAKMAAFLQSQIIYPLDEFARKRKDELDRIGMDVMQSETIAVSFLANSRAECQKLEKIYREKGRDWQSTKDSNSLPKNLKAHKDMATADAEYRLAVCKREEERLKLEDKRYNTIQYLANFEQERLKRTAEHLRSYLDVEHKWAEQSITMVQDYKFSIKDLDVTKDKAMYVRAYEERWPAYLSLLYYNLQEGESKDFVFGVPLDVHLKATRRHVPLVLQKCIQAVEARGLKREGLYRISAKQSDILELRTKLEKDLSKVHLDDETYDVHVICGVIKMFLRELPDPLLDIPEKERKDYQSISAAKRIAMIQFWLKPEFRPTLKYLVYHLANVAGHCEDNKMTMQNLAVVFGPPILNGSREHGGNQVEVPKVKTNIFDKIAASAAIPRNSTPIPKPPSATDIDGLELVNYALVSDVLTSDLMNLQIIEELIRDRDQIFRTSDKSVKPANKSAEFPSRFDSLPTTLGDALPQPLQSPPRTASESLLAAVDQPLSHDYSSSADQIPTPVVAAQTSPHWQQ